MSWRQNSDGCAATRHLVRHPWHAYPVCVILSGMSDRLLAAARAHKRAKRAYERSYEDLVEAIVEAADKDTPQVEIVQATGYTRETIRRIVSKVREEREAALTEGRDPRRLGLRSFR